MVPADTQRGFALDRRDLVVSIEPGARIVSLSLS